MNKIKILVWVTFGIFLLGCMGGSSSEEAEASVSISIAGVNDDGTVNVQLLAHNDDSEPAHVFLEITPSNSALLDASFFTVHQDINETTQFSIKRENIVAGGIIKIHATMILVDDTVVSDSVSFQLTKAGGYELNDQTPPASNPYPVEIKKVSEVPSTSFFQTTRLT